MQVPTLKAWLFSGCKMVASLLLTMPARMASSAAFSLPFCGLGPAMTALQVAVPSCGTTACCGIETSSQRRSIQDKINGIRSMFSFVVGKGSMQLHSFFCPPG